MMKVKIAIFIFLIFLKTDNIFAENTIFLTGSDWCPYICTEVDDSNSLAENPGYLVEIIQYALKGYTIKYESPSWERAILETRKGTYDAIIGIYTTVAPDFIYPETEVGFSRMCFYIHKDSTWEFKNLDSLSDITLGIIEGYFYDEGEVDAYIRENINDHSKVEAIPGSRGLIQNLEKMLLGRVTAIIDDYQVINFTISSHNLPKAFRLAGCLEGIDVQIGFSPKNPKSKDYAKKITIALNELRRSGKLKDILNRYGIKDWKQKQ
jgi:polar amino acid transport system substrate-binding protein